MRLGARIIPRLAGQILNCREVETVARGKKVGLSLQKKRNPLHLLTIYQFLVASQRSPTSVKLTLLRRK
ncbi:hypothetical protein OKW43_005900 [Paraburkholderia sp. WC7.3g]